MILPDQNVIAKRYSDP